MRFLLEKLQHVHNRILRSDCQHILNSMQKFCIMAVFKKNFVRYQTIAVVIVNTKTSNSVLKIEKLSLKRNVYIQLPKSFRFVLLHVYMNISVQTISVIEKSCKCCFLHLSHENIGQDFFLYT